MTAAKTQKPEPVITGRGCDDQGRAFLIVDSRTTPGKSYRVTRYSDHLSCQCLGSQHGYVCCHRQAARKFWVIEREMERARVAKASANRGQSMTAAPLHRDNRPFSIFAAE